jgi:hypothetical protein
MAAAGLDFERAAVALTADLLNGFLAELNLEGVVEPAAAAPILD